MKTIDRGAQDVKRIQYLRRVARRRAKVTSVHLILFAAALMIAFGGVMKIVNG